MAESESPPESVTETVTECGPTSSWSVSQLSSPEYGVIVRPPGPEIAKVLIFPAAPLQIARCRSRRRP